MPYRKLIIGFFSLPFVRWTLGRRESGSHKAGMSMCLCRWNHKCTHAHTRINQNSIVITDRHFNGRPSDFYKHNKCIDRSTWSFIMQQNIFLQNVKKNVHKFVRIKRMQLVYVSISLIGINMRILADKQSFCAKVAFALTPLLGQMNQTQPKKGW